jgi:hypothetical protein
MHAWLVEETRALLTRLDRIKPFALLETMVPAAAPSPAALSAIEQFLVHGRRSLRRMARSYLKWLRSGQGQATPPAKAHRRFVFLKLQFNDVLSQFDIFADVMTQRSEHETGVWLSGLDVVAADALKVPGDYMDMVPVICHLDRGHGAAIRRARTRLPGGGENPVAVVRVPRERMVGSGIASSLVHEVGHQGAALLDLIKSLRGPLNRLSRQDSGQGPIWGLYGRWISEILADFWSVSRIGVGSTLGLMSVVSLPRAFIFRVSLDDPHPIPWLRVKLSCALGNALYPDPQWERTAAMWEAYYPLTGLSLSKRRFFTTVEARIPDFVALLVNHRPPSLRGRSLGEVMTLPDRHPGKLRALHQSSRGQAARMRRLPPSLAFAVLGQARADGRIDPGFESRLLVDLLTYWALRSTLKKPVQLAAQVWQEL